MNEISHYFDLNSNQDYIFNGAHRIIDIPIQVFQNIPIKINSSLKSTLIFKEESIGFNDFEEKELDNICIKFVNCEFNKGLKIISKNCSYFFIDYKKSTQISYICINGHKTSNSITLQDSFIDIFHLDEVNLSKLSINNSEISKLKVLNESKITELSITAYSQLNENKINQIEFENSVISSFMFHWLKTSGKIKFKNIYSKNIYIGNSNINMIEIINYNTQKFTVDDSYLDFIRINMVDESDIDAIESSERGRKFDSINIKSNRINLVEIIGTKFFIFDQINLKGKEISVRNLNSDSLKLSGSLVEESNFSNCEFTNLIFDKFDSFKKLRFNDITISSNETLLKANNSTLNNLILSPSFLHNFKLIDFVSSSFYGITLHNFKIIEPQKIINFRIDNLQKIEFVRELNSIMLANHHKYYHTIYRALEQDLSLKTDRFLTGFDRFIVLLNSISNGHGTKPQKALICYIVLFAIHILCIRIDFCYQHAVFTTYDFFTNHYSYFFKPLTFISDLNLKDSMGKECNFIFSGWIKILDFVFKLLYGYLIFQFIAAFRKFNK
jgi:hypothetical protein